MPITAQEALDFLLAASPSRTSDAPRDSRGLYGLIDHLGDLRYIGSTSSTSQTFYERIHQRHRTGSEGMSHYFSQMYNTGRMWRNREDALTKADGDIAKALRNEFVVDHCRAVWLSLPDTANIGRLEAEVLALAPDHAIAWNRRRMQPYDEPVDLVDATLQRLGWDDQRLAAIDRQRLRFAASKTAPVAASAPKGAPIQQNCVPPFPKGPFRFFALDVETANRDRGSICQIGVACVRLDHSIETWVTYVDPQVDHWVFTYLHGIDARTVQGAPGFAEVLAVLRDALAGATVYQHSGFDRSAVVTACEKSGLPIPHWDWRDSVHAARTAWPELRGNGGHGLASLKQHLGLKFDHHDAGEDARAAAEVVLHAEGIQPVSAQIPADCGLVGKVREKSRKLISDTGELVVDPAPVAMPSQPILHGQIERLIGTTEITQGNIDNNHIYLRGFFEKFPADAIGGSNRASAAMREVAVDWGGGAIVRTDLDGKKKFFRKRGWIREFFELHGLHAGDVVMIEEIAPYSYRVAPQRRT